MKRVKPALLLLFLAVLVLSSCGSGKKNDNGFYRHYFTDELTKEYSLEPTLRAFSEGLAVITDEGTFDRSYIEGQAALLVDEDADEVLYAKAAYERVYPASLTKCMTALLVLENCELSDEVTVTEEAVAGLDSSASMAGVVPGAVYSVSDLLYAMLIPSGNDAANALAIHTAGSVAAFAEMMNSRARSLGMLDTHFVNANGLHHKNHYTTAYDLYLLMRACMAYPDFPRYSAAYSASVTGTLPDGREIRHDYKSGNSYILKYTELPEGLTLSAVKTGYTVQAGRCLITAVTRADGHICIGVVLKAVSYDAMYIQMNRLLTLAVPG